MSPDLLITTTYGRLKGRKVVDWGRVFLNDGIFVEVKAQESWDLPLVHSGSQASTRFQYPLTNNQKGLFLQIIRYVSVGQFSSLPYTHIYIITVTGPKLRIWQFSPNGVQVTDAIAYLEDARPFVKFLLAISKDGKRGMGLNIGGERMFQQLDSSLLGSISNKLARLAKLYADKANNPIWLHSFETQQTGVWELNVPHDKKLLASSLDRFFVFQQPVHSTTGMFSRGTHCYLVVSAQMVLSKDFDLLTDSFCLLHMHMLKTAWQWDSRTPELKFFQMFKDRYEKISATVTVDTDFLNIATPLAGGQSIWPTNTVPSSPGLNQEESGEQVIADAGLEDSDVQDDDKGEDKDLEYGFSKEALASVRDNIQEEKKKHEKREDQPATRTLQWILFREIGTKIINAADSRELIQCIVDNMDGTLL
jgi:hypothetical protein